MFLWAIAAISTWLVGTLASSGALVLVASSRSDAAHVAPTIHSYQQRYNNRFHHDWVIISQRGTLKEYRDTIREIAKGSTVKFIELKNLGSFLTFPEDVDTNKVRKLRRETALGQPWRRLYNSLSSRHFTRFGAGHFYNFDNIWLAYQYYWRVPVGATLGCDVTYDVFQHMEDNGLKYGFLLLRNDPQVMYPTFLSKVQQYVEDANNQMQPSPRKNNFQFLIESGEVNEDLSWKARGCHFDADSEIGSIDFFQSEQYKHYFNHIDGLNGIYYETWRESAIKTAAVSLFLLSSEVKFMDLPVQSPMFGAFNCPADSSTFVAQRCTCDANNHEKDYKFGWLKMKAKQMLQDQCQIHWNSVQLNN